MVLAINTAASAGRAFLHTLHVPLILSRALAVLRPMATSNPTLHWRGLHELHNDTFNYLSSVGETHSITSHMMGDFCVVKQLVPHPVHYQWMSTSVPPSRPPLAISNNITLWSNDLHVGPIGDLKDLFARLRPNIFVHWIDNSFSIYCEFSNSCAKGHKILSVLTFDKLALATDQFVNEFYNVFRNDRAIQQVDAFVCSHTPALCRFFVPFSKPIIADFAVPLHRILYLGVHVQWVKEVAGFVADKKNVAVANNGFLSKLAAVHLGVLLPTVPNLCLYPQVRHSSSSGIDESLKKVLIMRLPHPPSICDASRLNKVASKMQANIAFTAYPPGMKWSSVAQDYTAVVYCPYTHSQMVFYETYNMNVPIVMPSLEFSMRYPTRQTYGAVPDDITHRLPLEEWQKAMDYYSGMYPHLLYFHNQLHLVTLIKNTSTDEFREISNRMASRTAVLLNEALHFWCEVLGRLLQKKNR